MKLLSDIINRASNLTELCGAYLADLGFLPLAPPYGLAIAVRKWLDSNPGVEVWQEVWETPVDAGNGDEAEELAERRQSGQESDDYNEQEEEG